MAQDHISLPDDLPPLEKGLEVFCQWRDEPRDVFHGHSLIELFKGPFIDIDRVWVTGSSAWTPLLFGKPTLIDRDVDLWFYDEDQGRAFIHNVVERLSLSAVDNPAETEENGFGGLKLKLPKQRTHHLFDVSWLAKGRTIGEVVCEFPRSHERVAICMRAQPGDIDAVTRLVRPWKHDIYDKRHKEECPGCKRSYDNEMARDWS